MDNNHQELKAFLQGIVNGREGFELGEPWKYSEEALAVVVPIIRRNAPKRNYITMYEVLKDMAIKDSGSVDKVELQNQTGKAVFIRAGTIFKGETQNRASENSKVLRQGKHMLNVRCIHQTHGISQGSDMVYGDIAPMSITMNLIAQTGQQAVWDSVRRYTGGDHSEHVLTHGYNPANIRSDRLYTMSSQLIGIGSSGKIKKRKKTLRDTGEVDFDYSNSLDEVNPVYSNSLGEVGPGYSNSLTGSAYHTNSLRGTGTDDLLGHMKAKNDGSKMLDDMMQRVPLFDFQAGAIIFNPVGIVALETFDHPMSWEAIKKEVIEKHGDKIMDEQADHLFELKPDRIKPAIQKFIDRLNTFKEQTVSNDGFSETRILVGNKIVGEYTLVEGRIVHSILAKEN